MLKEGPWLSPGDDTESELKLEKNPKHIMSKTIRWAGEGQRTSQRTPNWPPAPAQRRGAARPPRQDPRTILVGDFRSLRPTSTHPSDPPGRPPRRVRTAFCHFRGSVNKILLPENAPRGPPSAGRRASCQPHQGLVARGRWPQRFRHRGGIGRPRLLRGHGDRGRAPDPGIDPDPGAAPGPQPQPRLRP